MSETYMLDDPPTVLEWYDFLCPFCYVGQFRTAILVWQTETYWEIHANFSPNHRCGLPSHNSSAPSCALRSRRL